MMSSWWPDLVGSISVDRIRQGFHQPESYGSSCAAVKVKIWSSVTPKSGVYKFFPKKVFMMDLMDHHAIFTP